MKIKTKKFLAVLAAVAVMLAGCASEETAPADADEDDDNDNTPSVSCESVIAEMKIAYNYTADAVVDSLSQGKVMSEAIADGLTKVDEMKADKTVDRNITVTITEDDNGNPIILAEYDDNGNIHSYPFDGDGKCGKSSCEQYSGERGRKDNNADDNNNDNNNDGNDNIFNFNDSLNGSRCAAAIADAKSAHNIVAEYITDQYAMGKTVESGVFNEGNGVMPDGHGIPNVTVIFTNNGDNNLEILAEHTLRGTHTFPFDQIGKCENPDCSQYLDS